MLARGCRPSLWRSRLSSVSISHRVQSHFSSVPHLASWAKIPDVFSSPLAPRESISPIPSQLSNDEIKNLEEEPIVLNAVASNLDAGGSDDAKASVPEISQLNGAKETRTPGEQSIGFKSFGFSPHLRISQEVRAALAANKPVVALESTIYTHGLPYPDNIELAVHLEATLRDMGVVPATIGLVDGVAVIGLSSSELSTLASAAGQPETMKVSRRDLPYIIGMGLAGKKLHGGTTVAATMILAAKCGINVFATGGIGGVHRGGQDSMDVSADLTELGRTSMAVIASGCKSFLDIPRTLEFLETQGVTVATYKENPEGSVPFPAFYTTDSGVKSPLVVTSPQQAAAIIYAQTLLGRSFAAGFLLANPIPVEFAIPKASIDAAIDGAVEEAAAQGFTGHRNTPFILARIKELTKGQSVVANKALIESNVKVGGRVAQALSDLRSKNPSLRVQNANKAKSNVRITTPRDVQIPNKPQLKPKKITRKADVIDVVRKTNVDVVVFGSLAVDLSCDYSSPIASSSSPALNTSNIATIKTSIGGVGHNVALAIHRATAGKVNVRLMSYVADDIPGTAALTTLQSEGLDTTGVIVKQVASKRADGTTRSNQTAQYVSVNDKNKDLVVAMADMSVFGNRSYPITPNEQAEKDIINAKWTVIDANWDPQVIHHLARGASRRNSKTAFEPVSIEKSTRLFNIKIGTENKTNIFPRNLMDLASPNRNELAAMHAAAKANGLLEEERWWKVVDAMGIPSSGARDRIVHITNAKLADEGIPVQSIQLLPFIPVILTKLGAAGVLHTELLLPDDPRLTDPASAPFILSRCGNSSTEIGGVYMRLYPAAEVVDNVVSVNGVGDTFLGVLVAGLASGWKLDEDLIYAAQRGAVMTLRSSEAVAPEIQGLMDAAKKDSQLIGETEEILGLLDI